VHQRSQRHAPASQPPGRGSSRATYPLEQESSSSTGSATAGAGEYLWAFVSGWESAERLTATSANAAQYDPTIWPGTTVTIDEADVIDSGVVRRHSGHSARVPVDGCRPSALAQPALVHSLTSTQSADDQGRAAR